MPNSFLDSVRWAVSAQGAYALFSRDRTDLSALIQAEKGDFALKEAERFRAAIAIVLVHSFNRTADEMSWNDCRSFGSLLGVDLCEGGFRLAKVETAVPLYFGWVSSQPAELSRLLAAI